MMALGQILDQIGRTDSYCIGRFNKTKADGIESILKGAGFKVVINQADETINAPKSCQGKTGSGDMKPAPHSLLAPALPIGANRNQLIAELGEPQQLGRGLGGSMLLSYREKTIQCSLRADRLFLLALYFRPAVDLSNWPKCLATLAHFSGTMKPSEVEEWLLQHRVQWRRITVGSEEVIEAPVGTRFYFESGLLSSIQIISEAPTSDSPSSTPRG